MNSPVHWNPSSIGWGISSEDYDPGVKHVVPGVAVGATTHCYWEKPWRHLHDQLKSQILSYFQLTFSQPPVLIQPKPPMIRLHLLIYFGHKDQGRPSVSQRFSPSLQSQSSYRQTPTIWQRLLDASMRAHRLPYGASPPHALDSKNAFPSSDGFSFVRAGAIPLPNPQIELWQ